MKEFLENKLGVHLMSVNIGGEFTLCGVSFDISSTEDDYEFGELEHTDKKVVTCSDCIEIINHCRNVKTGESK